MAEHDADPAVMLADTGYDSDVIRDAVRAPGGTPEIATENKRRLQHTVNLALHATRNRIERLFNRLKNCRRVATRYDHTATIFLGFAKLAAIKQWINFVTATQSCITECEVGEALTRSVWTPGVSHATWSENDSLEGYLGVTLKADIDGDGLVETAITWTGIIFLDLPKEVMMEVSGIGVLYFS